MKTRKIRVGHRRKDSIIIKNEAYPEESAWYDWSIEEEMMWVCDLIGMEIMRVHLLCLECGNGLDCCVCE